MITTHTPMSLVTNDNQGATPEEPLGTIWVDFGDGGGARWAKLTLHTLDQVCDLLEQVKPADTIT